MKKKVLKFILLIFLLLIIVALGYFVFSTLSTNFNKIPEDYIAIFHGGSGEITYETYIYKIDNGHANYGFSYINTTSNTISYGNTEWKTKVTSKGEVTWTDDVFEVAKENNAYSYVTLPNDTKIYTIEEYANMFLMN